MFHTNLTATPAILDAPEDDTAAGGGCHHLVLVSMGTPHHFSIKCDTFNGPFKVRGGKDLLPSRGFLNSVPISENLCQIFT